MKPLAFGVLLLGGLTVGGLLGALAPTAPPGEARPLLLLRAYTATNYPERALNKEWQQFNDDHPDRYVELNPFEKFGADYSHPRLVTNYVFGVRSGTNSLELFERVHSGQFVVIRPL